MKFAGIYKQSKTRKVGKTAPWSDYVIMNGEIYVESNYIELVYRLPQILHKHLYKYRIG